MAKITYKKENICIFIYIFCIRTISATYLITVILTLKKWDFVINCCQAPLTTVIKANSHQNLTPRVGVAELYNWSTPEHVDPQHQHTKEYRCVYLMTTQCLKIINVKLFQEYFNGVKRGLIPKMQTLTIDWELGIGCINKFYTHFSYR